MRRCNIIGIDIVHGEEGFSFACSERFVMFPYRCSQDCCGRSVLQDSDHGLFGKDACAHGIIRVVMRPFHSSYLG